jgi:hypothetical protein
MKSKFHIIAIFVTVNIQTTFSHRIIGIFLVYAYTTFQMHSSNDSLVVATKLKAKYRLCAARRSVLHPAKEGTLAEVSYTLNLTIRSIV